MRKSSLFSINQFFSNQAGFCNHVFNKMNYRSTDCGTCKAFDECHKGKGVCWKLIIQGYGDKYIYYPDPRCPSVSLTLRYKFNSSKSKYKGTGAGNLQKERM